MSHLVINTFRMRNGITSDQFAVFSASIDQPTLLSHRDLVTRFDVHQVQHPTEGSPLGVDIVEIMEVSDWARWVEVRDQHPSLNPVTAGFDELVDLDSVRSSFVVPVLRGHHS